MSLSLISRPTLDELGTVIGAEKLARLVDRFTAGLSTAFPVGDGNGAYGREAHTLVSMSGMLGCELLSAACRGLERSANEGADLTASLAEIRTLRDRTVTALLEWRAGTGAAQ